MAGLYMPVYSFEGNKFIVIGNPCYDTEQEAIDAGLADGVIMMMQGNIQLLPETYKIPFEEEESEWMLNMELRLDTGSAYEVAIFAGPVYDAEDFDED